MSNPLPPIDYSSRDFVSLQADIANLAQFLMPEWTNVTSPTDFGNVLIELFAYAGDVLGYYIDRIANEALLSTAQRPQTVLNMAKMFNYIPVRSAPATGTVKFTLVPGAVTTTIPALTQVSNIPTVGNDAIVFETSADLVISGSDAATPVNTNANGSITITQGVTVTNEVLASSSDGTANASFTLYNPKVIAGSTTITTTNGLSVITWKEIANILDAKSSDKVYTTSVDQNNITTVQFGDGTFGAVPTKGSLITVTYRIGGGAFGNLAVGAIKEMVNPVAAVLSVSNTSATTGGTDAETVASMRTTIPASLYALNRAVTLVDYEALAIKVPGIAKARATSTSAAQVVLRLAPVGGNAVSNPSCTGPFTSPGTQKYAVDQYLSDKKMVNVSIVYTDPSWDAINIAATVHLLPNYYQVTVQRAVTSAIQTLLSFDNVNFGTTITVSQVYHAILAVDGVAYANLTTLVEANNATPSGVQDVLPLTTQIPYLGTLTLSMVGGVS